MKISKQTLDAIVQDDEGKQFEDGTTHATLIRTAARAQMYIGGDGKPIAFDEGPDDKFKIGMVCFKIAKAQKNLVLSSEDVTLLKRRAAKLFNAPMYVRFCDLMEDKGTAERRAEKENTEGDEEKKAA